MVATIERRLPMIESLEQGANLLLLASTIPDERVRAAILRTFKSHWDEVPQPLEAARAAENALPEPGLLLLAKVMPRKDAAAFGISKGGAPRAPASVRAAATDSCGRSVHAGLHLDAIHVYERMLQLNPNDNQGVRDPLLGLYLTAGDLKGAGALLNKYENDALANFAWGRVLERFLSDDHAGAKAAARN